MSYSLLLTKFKTLGFFFSRAVKTVVVVAKLVILGILLLISLILALRAAEVTKLVILGLSFLTLFF